MDTVTATLAGVPNTEVFNKLNNLEKENANLKKAIDDLRKLVLGLQARVELLESGPSKQIKPECSKVSFDMTHANYFIL